MAQWVAHLTRIWSVVNFKAQSNALVESLSMKLLPLVLSWFQELILSSKDFLLHNQTEIYISIKQNLRDLSITHWRLTEHFCD